MHSLARYLPTTSIVGNIQCPDSQGRLRAMPDSFGKLTPQEKEKATNWVNTRWATKSTCPICATRKWVVGDYLVQVNIYGPAAFIPSAPVFPHAQVFCGTCGYTIFFNAVMIGIAAPYQEPPPVLPKIPMPPFPSGGQQGG